MSSFMPDDSADYIEGAAASTTAGPEERVVTLEAAAGAGERIDRFVAAALPGYSRTRIQRWLALGAVTVDGLSVLPKYRLRGHETIELVPLPSDAEQAFEPDEVAFPVVYEDADLVVVDKPAGLVTHPGSGNWRGTLMNGVLHRWPDSARLPRAGIVHRLDKDTSGLLMIARSERAFERLTAMISDRSVQRRYVALVAGRLDAPVTIDAPIGRDPRDRLRMAVVAPERGKPAQTQVVPLGVARHGTREVSLVECRLQTGRTHQIRVHLAYSGHPLVGDALYGGAPLEGFTRQALHAWRLRLPHPGGDGSLDLCAPLPADLAALLAAVGLADRVGQPQDPARGHGP
jgi:23S rRNA pseudouridine1911/1915/1917 synthase